MGRYPDLQRQKRARWHVSFRREIKVQLNCSVGQPGPLDIRYIYLGITHRKHPNLVSPHVNTSRPARDEPRFIVQRNRCVQIPIGVRVLRAAFKRKCELSEGLRARLVAWRERDERVAVREDRFEEVVRRRGPCVPVEVGLEGLQDTATAWFVFGARGRNKLYATVRIYDLHELRGARCGYFRAMQRNIGLVGDLLSRIGPPLQIK